MQNLQNTIQKIRQDLFYQHFEKVINKKSDLVENDKIIIAVSGGVDSITLLYLMKAINIFKICVAHINHKIRVNSDSDEDYVKLLSKNMGLKFVSKSLNPNMIASGKSNEEWARNERYDFLMKLAKETKSKKILTAHHSNDQIETILMNIARGSGVLGLRGIARENKYLLRPLLDFKKKEISEFSQRIKFKFIEDETNKNLSIPRNFLRHKVVKPWEKELPFLSEAFKNTVDNISKWQSALDYFINNFILIKVEIFDDGFLIEKNFITVFPSLIKLRVIQLLIVSDKDNLWSRHQIKMLENFFNKNEIGKVFKINNHWRLLWDRNDIIGQKVSRSISKKSILIPKNLRVYHNNLNISIRISRRKDVKFKTKYEVVDWSKLKNTELKIRLWKQGDIFQPLGMNGHQKLSDFLINNKVDQFQKEKQHIVIANDEIIWICGLRISEMIKVTNKTTEFAYLILE
jgi:tRNA(Ile)-lysidine synthase